MRFKKTVASNNHISKSIQETGCIYIDRSRTGSPRLRKSSVFNDFMPNNLPCADLSGSDARNFLHKIKYEAFRTNDGIVHHPTSQLHGIMGSLCVTPEWMSLLPYTTMPYLRKCIYTLYDPWEQLLYISEDCSELSWDYYEGFCISNVPPTILGVDMGKIERHFSEHCNRQNLASSGLNEVAK